MSPSLSKSRFLSGEQCDLRLWYECFRPELASAPDAMTEALFATGHEVGRLARRRFPGGTLVEADHQHGGEAVRATRALMARGGPPVPAIYEGGFEHAGVRVRADVLVRGPDGGWDLVEVKSTTGVKAVHDLDVAIQAWVLRGAGVDLRRAGVLTLDRGYRWPGGPYDLEALFALHDRTGVVESLLPGLGPEVARLHAVLAAVAAPAIGPGPQCTTPYECPFLAHCTRHVVAPEWPLRTLPSLGARRREALEAMGVQDVREIPAGFTLTPLQSVARDAARSGADAVHGDLAGALASVAYPVHHLDFETCAPALPRYPGTRPYDPVPFQFSLHTELADGAVRHAEYLHPDAGDPREPLARALLDALGEAGSIVVYTGFEQRVIVSLAAALPALAPRLEALLPRLFDLHPLVRSSYYHPAFRGSFSMKSVLPALAPDLGYDGLAIADGALAAVRYEEALRAGEAERARIFADLRDYCGRDTEGLLRIRRELAARARVHDV